MKVHVVLFGDAGGPGEIDSVWTLKRDAQARLRLLAKENELDRISANHYDSAETAGIIHTYDVRKAVRRDG